MKRFLLAAAAVVAFSGLARAADLPANGSPTYQAPYASSIFNGYPYGSSGVFFGVYTEAGGGSVSGTVPGVGSASLTETQAGVGGTIGYAWGAQGSPVAGSVEGDFGWTNYNGSNSGLSLEGPLHFEQRGVLFSPLSTVIGMIPGLSTLGTLPPFNALPAGLTASNIQVGIMAGVDEDDISPDFVGVAADHEWRVAPMIGLVQMEQISNGTALRTWLKAVFPDKSVCLGTVSQGTACANLGTQIKAGVGVYF
jgi:opacity protein-like surface antigen